MTNKSKPTIGENLYIIWAIARKDILDAVKNKVVVSIIILLSIIMLLPKLLPLIFEQPQMTIPIYDLGKSTLVSQLENDPEINVIKLQSDQEMQGLLCGNLTPMIALRLPSDFDQTMSSGEPNEIQGYLCWSKRFQSEEMQSSLEEVLRRSLGRSMVVHVEGNILYPPSDGVLGTGITMINFVLLVLTMGIYLVPSLLFEEKETKTLQALLVSPASIGQVVIGKAVAGVFYILVTAVMIFSISWTEVVHWDLAILFVICGSLFSVSVGLVLGSFFEKQQDMLGTMTALVLVLLGAVLVRSFGVEVPTFLDKILPWVPSVALAQICQAIFLRNVNSAKIWFDLFVNLIISLPLYGLVIWKVNRSDR